MNYVGSSPTLRTKFNADVTQLVEFFLAKEVVESSSLFIRSIFMNETPKKLKFEDLQPHVDMLCDALENKGASVSGYPYNPKVYPQAQAYRNLLAKIRAKEISGYDLEMMLHTLKAETLEFAGNNQRHRISNLVDALDFFVRKEYNKIYN